MALSPKYITATDLCEVFIDKDSGLPLAGGQIQFWVDGARTTPKLVYELTGDPTNSQGGGYSYVPFPNPITLSNVGTIQDNNGNNVPLYYYPFDANGALELYYIVVLNANGVMQFTREAWPNAALEVDAPTETGSENQVLNPQFALVNFDTNLGLTIDVTGSGSSVYEIAPNWDLAVTYNGTGSVTINQVPIAGDTNYPGNPAYWLSVTSTAAITGLKLQQRFLHTAGIWAQTNNASNGWLSSTITISPNTTVTMNYVPYVGAATQLLSAANPTVAPQAYTSSVQLPPSTDVTDSEIAYVKLEIQLPVNQSLQISNVQIVTSPENIGSVAYIQDSWNKQVSMLYSYYNSGLQFKPTKSFLVGWDFPLNPAQINGDSGTIPAGANRSAYAWDQTIIYSGTSGAVSYSRAPSGALRVTAGADVKLALVQYLPAAEARKILNQPVSAMVSALTDDSLGVPATISLWYTDSAGNLPSCDTGTYQSIVQSLDNNGMVSTFNNPSVGTWTQVPRAQGFDARFQIQTAGDINFNYYGFNGWYLNSPSVADTATFFAIVIGIGNLSNTKYIDFNSVSLVPGTIPTVPAAQTVDSVLAECQRYYWKTYPAATTAPNGATTGMMLYPGNYAYSGGVTYYFGASFNIVYPIQMRTTPALSFYGNAGTANEIAVVLDYNGGSDTTNYSTVTTPVWTFTNGTKSLSAQLTTIAGTPPSVSGVYNVDVTMRFFVKADARLGIVN